ncbi:hypothetical protein Fmac_021365 [Flemingia macrophylla]|uniref:Uncharacterized protein n=1 Tax=Flemingia macrophylla TaxID=520843 RepID=A0ABD1LWN9_9FABA
MVDELVKLGAQNFLKLSFASYPVGSFYNLPLVVVFTACIQLASGWIFLHGFRSYQAKHL